MLKFIKICIVALALISCKQKNDNLSEMVIMTSKGPIIYQVESATTKEQMSQGLMNRKELRSDSGMIFALNGAKDIAMWMKDTYIPLDILFVNKDGKIISFYKNAEPLSTKLIKPQVNEPLAAVIEINGGDIEKNNISIGDTVRHELINKNQ